MSVSQVAAFQVDFCAHGTSGSKDVAAFLIGLAETPLFTRRPVMAELNAINVPFQGERSAHGRTRDVGF